MQVKCIDDKAAAPYLSVGQTYTVVEEHDTKYKIEHATKVVWWFKRRFVVIEGEQVAAAPTTATSAGPDLSDWRVWAKHGAQPGECHVCRIPLSMCQYHR